MPKRTVFERSRRELSLDVSVGVHILLVVEQSRLESQSRGCSKTPILTVYPMKSVCPYSLFADVTLSYSGVTFVFVFVFVPFSLSSLCFH